MSCAALALAGCSTNTVVFTTATRLGVEINSTEPGQQGAHVGYERFEGAIMPMVATDKEQAESRLDEAYPIYSRHYFHIGSLKPKFLGGEGRGIVVIQAFATGAQSTTQTVRTSIDNQFAQMRFAVPNMEAQQVGSALLQGIDRVTDTSVQTLIIEKTAEAFPKSPKPTNIIDVKRIISTAMRTGQKMELMTLNKSIGNELK